MKTVKVDQMGAAIVEAMNEYKELTADAVKEATQKAAKSAVKELKATSPKKTGDYCKGWTSKKVTETSNKIEVVVHNRTEYQLAHLLEYGHALTIGGRKYPAVPAKPHIANAEKNAAELLEKEIIIKVRKK